MKIILSRGDNVIEVIDTHNNADFITKKVRENLKREQEKFNNEKSKKQPEEKKEKLVKEKPKPTIECPLGYKFYTKEEMCDFYNVDYSRIRFSLYNYESLDKYRKAILLNIINEIHYYSRNLKLNCGITVVTVDDNDFCECIFDENTLIIKKEKLYDYMLNYAKKIYDEKNKEETA